MSGVRVLQLGPCDYTTEYTIANCAEWIYEPDFSEKVKLDYDLIFIEREITEEEKDAILGHSRAYTLYVPDDFPVEPDSALAELYARKMGKRIERDDLVRFLKEDIPMFFSGSYGEKLRPEDMCPSENFSGSVHYEGFEGLFLEGDFGESFSQAMYWRYNTRIETDGCLEFWLEYEHDEDVEIELKITEFIGGTVTGLGNVRIYTEDDLKDLVVIRNSGQFVNLFFTVMAKGSGRLNIKAMHSRKSRDGYGSFMPGGERFVTSEREEAFFYFDPGDMKPPLNVYFSGYKTQEGFEGYYMMRKMGCPFLLVAEARLEGGAFYLGSDEFEDMIADRIKSYMDRLGFGPEQVVFSGLSMGTFGAMYYGCRIKPWAILLGKPLASLGDVAENERINRPGGFPTSLDVLYKNAGGLDDGAASRLNTRFWNSFENTSWESTKFVVSYMIDDDYENTAYQNLLFHLNGTGIRIYGKGLHGRHNDDTVGIVTWFLSQYKSIIEQDFRHE